MFGEVQWRFRDVCVFRTTGSEICNLSRCGYQDWAQGILCTSCSLNWRCADRMQGLMPSLLASLEAQTHLAKTTDVRTFLCARPLVLLTERLQEAIPGSAMIVVPELEDWLFEEEVSEYEYKKTWEEAREDPFAVYHTSGSSGLSPRFFLTLVKTP